MTETPISAWTMFFFLAPTLAMVVAACYFLRKYYRCSKSCSLKNRFLSEALGPLSVVVPGVERKECRALLMRAYLCAGGAVVYAVLFIRVFGGSAG